VTEMKFIMEEASRIVLDGFTIRADCPEFDENGKLLEFPQIVRFPNRYMIKRGVGMWTKVMSDHVVALEPQMLTEFIDFARRCGLKC
jgi:hypothetical protein